MPIKIMAANTQRPKIMHKDICIDSRQVLPIVMKPTDNIKHASRIKIINTKSNLPNINIADSPFSSLYKHGINTLGKFRLI